MLKIKPIGLKEANEFVKKYHRHNLAVMGHKFSISCYENGRMCGVAICGRPVARKLNSEKILYLARNCTDGTYNACSKLYGACARIAKEMGYEKIITYILESENGASLKASNYQYDGVAGGKEWTGERKRQYQVAPYEMKKRYIYVANSVKEDKP